MGRAGFEGLFDDAEPQAIDVGTFRALAGKTPDIRLHELTPLEDRLLGMVLDARRMRVTITPHELLAALGRRPDRMGTGVVTEERLARQYAAMALRLLRDAHVVADIHGLVRESMDVDPPVIENDNSSSELQVALHGMAMQQAILGAKIEGFRAALRLISAEDGEGDTKSAGR